MAVTGAVIDYSGASGARNATVFLQLTFSGSAPAGGDPLNLSTLSNPNGLDVEGFFELGLTLAPAVYLEDIGGYYLQPKVSTATVNACPLVLYAQNGTGAVTGAYPSAVTNGTVVLTMQKRRV